MKNRNDSGSKKKWKHPGGKLLELGADKLSDAELLAIIIGTGIKGKSADKLAEEIMTFFSGFRGLAGQDMERLLRFKGLGTVKILRIAATLEIAKRIVEAVIKHDEAYGEYEQEK